MVGDSSTRYEPVGREPANSRVTVWCTAVGYCLPLATSTLALGS